MNTTFQTVSIVVPTVRCVNNCKMCCSKTHSNDYANRFTDVESDEYAFYREDIRRRLDYARLNGVDTAILTGTGEALQNKRYLVMVDDIMKEMGNPFPRIEIQTTGVMLNKDNLLFLRKMGVTTISLSISDLFDEDSNNDIIEIPKALQFNLWNLCQTIKEMGFNIRLSLNMSDVYNKISDVDMFFAYAKELGADQITFRELYHSDNDTKEDVWVKEHVVDKTVMSNIKDYIMDNGKALYILPFGATVYSIGNKISTVVDSDCMDTKKGADDVLKYLILRENAKLYSKWDDEGSLIF